MSDTALASFLADVKDEYEAAVMRFPNADGSTVALMEEVGELAKAMLEEPLPRVWEEAVQVAVMAARVALDGDPTLDEIRQRRVR